MTVSASVFYGIWTDADYGMSSDELVKEIKKSRTFKDDVEAF